ncbi:hypothetical protein [uncultured Paraglaciecola sp.]|uniref:hypothetical protein n=1 Tax=uncultured Paraglaciecola sp. TaxID=1765024 RepID=UPI00261AF97C|nr:hypothetical protein [uncultured Paraglaciecola sp.]
MSEVAENEQVETDVSAEVESKNLLDAVQSDAESTVSQEAANEQPWKWTSELDGAGDKPEWFKGDKYLTVADQAKAYTDLEAKFGNFTGAPEEYAIEVPADLALPEGITWEFDDNDPLLQAFIPVAKEMNLDQGGFDKMIRMFIEQEAQSAAGEAQTVEKEMAEVGDPNRVSSLGAFAKANMPGDVYNKFHDMLTTAASVDVFEWFAQQSRESMLPNPNDLPAAGAVTKDELAEMEGKKGPDGKLLWLTDKTHRAKIERMRQQYFGG